MTEHYIPYLAAARFTGEDAGAFLQSQLSADILALGSGETTLACYCTPKGKVLGLLLVGRQDQGYLLAGSAVLLPGVLRRLQMYVMRSKVQIEEAPSLRVIGRPGPVYSFTEDSGKEADVKTWRAAELRAGVSWLNEASSEKFIPQMLGFDAIGAVSFSKGCYPGQEIVARARYLGKVKRGPLIVHTEESPGCVPGDRLRVQRAGNWSDATLVDVAGKVLFSVAATAPEAVEEIEFEGRRYRCATM